MHILDFIPFIKHFHSFAYWFAFMAAMLETFIGIGLIIPGSTIIILLGGMAAEKKFDIGDLICFVVLGAIVGDTINYFLGKKFGDKISKKEDFFIKPSVLEKSKLFFKKYGGKSVFIGRFIPSLRETVPLIAGISNMEKKSFFIWNFLGALCWGIILPFIGYFFNDYLKISKLILTRSGIFILIIILILMLFNYIKNIIIERGSITFKIAKSIFLSIKSGLKENDYIIAFVEKHKKFFKFYHNRMNKNSFFGRPFTFFMIALVYLFFLFAGIVEDLINSDLIVFADVRIANLLEFFRHEFYNRIFLWITLLGKIEIVALITFITTILLWIWNRKLYILPFIAGITGSLVFSTLGKLAFHRARPMAAFYTEPTYSFPSGHATIAIMLYGFIAYILIKTTKKWKNKVNIFFGISILILLIGFSRLYLGVHYASDVWGGYLIGGIWLITSIGYSEYLLFDSIKKEEIHKKKFLYTGSLITLFIIVYLIIGINYNPQKNIEVNKIYTLVKTPLIIFKNSEMKFTESILGIKQEPISFIVTANDDKSLINAFENSGWNLADEISALSLLNSAKAVILGTPYPKAPMTPDFWNASVNNLGFEKPTESNSVKKRHHSRFWKTGFKTSNGQYIYVGTASLDENLKWAITHKINPNIDGERTFLFNDLVKANNIKRFQKVSFINPEIGKNFVGDLFFTDGQVLIFSIENTNSKK